MIYGIRITPTKTGFEVTCRDIPECIYEAKDEAQAQELAQEILPGALVLFYRKKRKAFPMPSQLQADEIPVFVPLKVQAKMLFWNFMQHNDYRIIDVAKKLGITHAEASRLVDITRDSASIDTIEQAFFAYDKDINLVANL